MSDMAEVILALMKEEARRRKEGRSDCRPDAAGPWPSACRRYRQDEDQSRLFADRQA